MYVSYIIIYSIIPMYMYMIVCKPNSVLKCHYSIDVSYMYLLQFNHWNDKIHI